MGIWRAPGKEGATPRFETGWKFGRRFALVITLAGIAFAQSPEVAATVRVNLDDRLRPMEIDRFGVGQGGFTPEPTWSDRMPEIRAKSEPPTE
jgi:hypothetical protein